ncbi:MAG: hypothetical protein H0X64_05165 [Gemmatimonadaceae bacterium]|nr:hypothetical protein [Gemmatimonadaceae bacterium]
MRFASLVLTALTASLLTAAAVPLAAQDTAVGAEPGTVRPAGRHTITVMDFDYGAVSQQIAGDKGTRKRLEKMGIRDGDAFASALGTGAASLIVEQLLASDAFRVLERKQLAAVEYEQSLRTQAGETAARAPRTAARYIVTGAITRVGFEEKKLGGAAGTAASFALSGLGAKKSRTEVHLTARLVDTETGDIVASFTGQGESGKGWGLTIFGIGSGGFGGFEAGSSNIRESAIGEAMEEAVAKVAQRIVEVGTREVAPWR